MSRVHLCARILATALLGSQVLAQVAVTPNARPASELAKDADKRLEANKVLVLNLFREVLEARHMDLADKYLAVDFIQHNPNAANGLAAFKEYFSRQPTPPRAIKPTVDRPVVALVAEGDMVILVSVRELNEPEGASKKYTTTAFDIYRIQNGKIVEHWDAATKAAGGPAVASSPVTVDPRPVEVLAKSPDKKLEANKTLVVNLWREIIEARHADLIDTYFSPAFIQHAPNMAPGLEGIRAMLGRGRPQPVEPTLKRKVTAMIAEDDIVVMAAPRELADPQDPSRKYTTTAIEMYRVENGKIAEHWDAQTKPAQSPRN
jgi:predicted SnoaL-like aldol condensation-catalyzing enzyme